MGLKTTKAKKSEPQPVDPDLDIYVAAALGRKAGRGFYDYREGAVRPEPQLAVAQCVPAEIVLHGDSAAAHAIADRLFERKIAHSWGEATDGRIAEVGGAVLFVTDGRTATQRAAETGIENVVLFDLALVYRTANRIAVGAALNCWAPAGGAIGGQQFLDEWGACGRRQ